MLFRLVAVSSSELRFIKPYALQRLEKEGSLEAVSTAIRSGDSTYSVSELGIPGLRHFFYKSRPHVQVTGPEFEEPYEDLQERRRCGRRSRGFAHVLIVVQVDYTLPTHSRRFARKVWARKDTEVTVLEDGEGGCPWMGTHISPNA